MIKCTHFFILNIFCFSFMYGMKSQEDRKAISFLQSFMADSFEKISNTSVTYPDYEKNDKFYTDSFDTVNRFLKDGLSVIVLWRGGFQDQRDTIIKSTIPSEQKKEEVGLLLEDLSEHEKKNLQRLRFKSFIEGKNLNQVHQQSLICRQELLSAFQQKDREEIKEIYINDFRPVSLSFQEYLEEKYIESIPPRVLSLKELTARTLLKTHYHYDIQCLNYAYARRNEDNAYLNNILELGQRYEKAQRANDVRQIDQIYKKTQEYNFEYLHTWAPHLISTTPPLQDIIYKKQLKPEIYPE